MAPTNQERIEKRLHDLQLTANALKGHVTRRLKAADAAMTMASRASPSSELMGMLRDHVRKIQEEYNKLYDNLRERQNLSNEEDFAGYEAEIDEENSRCEAMENHLYGLLAKIEEILRPPMPRAGAAGGQQPRNCKVATELRPEKLAKDGTPVELSNWIKAFSAYYNASHMELLDIPEQQAYFTACLDTYLKERIGFSTRQNTRVLEAVGQESCMSFLRQEFLLSHPVFTRRLEFFRARQLPGQLFTDFGQHLKKLGQQAQLDELETDDIYVMRMFTGINDERLLGRMLKERDPTCQSMTDLAQHYETAASTKKSIGTERRAIAAMVTAEVQAQVQYVERPRTGPRGIPERSERPASKGLMGEFYKLNKEAGKCTYCGDRKVYGPDAPKHKCKARDNTCKVCKKKGHYEKCCFLEWEKTQKTATSKLVTSNTDDDDDIVRLEDSDEEDDSDDSQACAKALSVHPKAKSRAA